MTRPPFAVLSGAFPRKNSVTRETLYLSIGHPEYVNDGRMFNTCGVRMSVALVVAGIPIRPGNITVQAGKYVGQRLESGQKRLANVLLRLWGEPEKYTNGPAAQRSIGTRRGVIAFHHLWSADDPQGHIDLVSPDSWDQAICADDCYWKASDVWFWSLK